MRATVLSSCYHLLLVGWSVSSVDAAALRHACLKGKQEGFAFAKGNASPLLTAKLYSMDRSILIVQEEEGRITLFCSAYVWVEDEGFDEERVFLTGIDSRVEDTTEHLFLMSEWFEKMHGSELEAGCLTTEESAWWDRDL